MGKSGRELRGEIARILAESVKFSHFSAKHRPWRGEIEEVGV
jgi:hypothetical protein